MKAQTVQVDDQGDVYTAIKIWCPGCASVWDHGGLHMLPVSGTDEKRPVWGWNGDLENVTLTPSILTEHGVRDVRCHSFLTNGVWQFLNDSTHSLKGQSVPMVDLPDWVVY